MATALSLNPLFRQTVGFDRFNDLFETLARDSDIKPSYPPYDITKTNENDYCITMAVAGFGENDIQITLENGTLKVNGQIENKADDSVEYLHRGIAKRSFEHSFRLADYMRVEKAALVNGLLNVFLHREVPEAKKPQRIPISNQSTTIDV